MATSESKIKIRSKDHGPYLDAQGVKLPSVTGIGRLRSIEGLAPAANKLGLEGINSNTHWKELAYIGTVTHAAILADLSGRTAESVLDGVDKLTRDVAENCYISFMAWRKQHDLKPIALEKLLVSETWSYGGTPDFIGYVDGVLELVDFKTGKGIYDSAFVQLAGYAALLVENKIIDQYPTRYRVLNIPRAETEAFAEKAETDLSVQWEIFKHWLAVYWLEKELEK